MLVKILQHYWKFLSCHTGVEKRQSRVEPDDEISRTCWDLSQILLKSFLSLLPTMQSLTILMPSYLGHFQNHFFPLLIPGLLDLERHNFFPYELYGRNIYSKIWKRSTERFHTNDDVFKLLWNYLVQAINSGLIPVAPSDPRFLSSCNLSPSLLHTMLPPTTGTEVNLWLNVSKLKVSQLGWRDGSVIND